MQEGSFLTYPVKCFAYVVICRIFLLYLQCCVDPENLGGKRTLHNIMDEGQNREHVKANINKIFDEQMTTMNLKELVIQYMILAVQANNMESVDLGTDSKFEQVLWHISDKSYDISQDIISGGSPMSIEEYDINVVTVLLTEISKHYKEGDVFRMYLLRWAASRVYELCLQEGLDKSVMEKKFRSCEFLDEEFLSPLEVDATELGGKTEEEQTDEFLDMYGEMKMIMTAMMPVLKAMNLDGFYEENRQNCIMLAMLGRMAGNMGQGKLDLEGVLSDAPQSLAKAAEIFDRFPFGPGIQQFISEHRNASLRFWSLGVTMETEFIKAGKSGLYNFAAMENYMNSGDAASASMLFDTKKR